jgi:DivIVA domain-containing protein
LPEQRRRLSEVRRVPAGIRNVAFPVAVRGYDRRAVDAYVIRINRLIAELEATRSPQRAVKHALERTEDERGAILERARELATAITARARREAEAITAGARAEAADIVVNASAEADRMKIDADQHAARVRTEAATILAESRTQAADKVQRAGEEIAALREEAEVWARELRRDTDAIWSERGELLGDLRDLATRLQEAVRDGAPPEGDRDDPFV